ncbi:MAG: hypothetical protein KBT11_02240 [Treponema sp.]|nr:hypothetical protein [Candidatus Treponema equifaecale]
MKINLQILVLRNTLGLEDFMKATRFNFVRVVMALAAFAAIGFGFTGCQQESETEYVYIYVEKLSKYDALIGNWSVTYDNGYKEQYNISTTAFDNNNGDGFGSYYAGKELCVSKLSDTEGYIYVKYTRSMNADWSYSESAPDVGKWYAIHYEDLTDSSIKISGAYKATGKTSTGTLAEAIQEFTVANGYFASHSAVTKE